jgi:hypothetical protein
MKLTQYDRVLKHLQDYGTITSWESFIEYGITRLSAVIFMLRRDGFNISSTFKTTKTRYGEPTSFAIYKLGD